VLAGEIAVVDGATLLQALKQSKSNVVNAI
jgi:hypothetical protein